MNYENEIDRLQRLVDSCEGELLAIEAERDGALIALANGAADTKAVDRHEIRLARARQMADGARLALADAKRRHDLAAAEVRRENINKANDRLRELLDERLLHIRAAFGALRTLADALDLAEKIADRVSEVRQSVAAPPLGWRLNWEFVGKLKLQARVDLDRFGFDKPAAWPTNESGLDLMSRALAEKIEAAVLVEENT